MELFPITLPKSNICTETELYYRSSQPVQYEEQAGQLSLKRKTVLTLDTYFNCFSYQKYLQYTSAQVLEVHLQLQGQFQLRLLKAQLTGKNVQRTVLLTQQAQQEQLTDTVILYDFSQESGNGFLYLELTALSKTAVFGGGFYASPIAEGRMQPTKIAAVICTYKREHYVQRNLDHLAQALFAVPEQEAAQHLEVFVVDNGRTLRREKIETPYVRLFPNKNCGGSGGFTRGIIEALRRKEEFSHVLLMDDDILLESNVLVKTIRFLQILRPEHQDLAIGGSMLRLDAMTVQHEAGGRWTGIRIMHGNHNLDLTETTALLQNEALKMPQYNAWWYCCLPLYLIDEKNLPLPFFIKVDDIEYGIRVIKKLLILNGIGIWHEPFENKVAPQLDYYDVRNKLVINTLYEKKQLLLKNLFLVMRYVGKNLLKGYPEMAVFSVMGCQDYLNGIRYFRELNLEKQHQALQQVYKKLENKKPHHVLFYWAVAGVQYIGLVIKMLFLYRGLKNDYQNNLKQIISIDYWTQKLEIEDENDIT